MDFLFGAIIAYVVHVRYLLKPGALKEKADHFGQTPLIIAAQDPMVSIDVLEALLEANASVQCKDFLNPLFPLRSYYTSTQLAC